MTTIQENKGSSMPHVLGTAVVGGGAAAAGKRFINGAELDTFLKTAVKGQSIATEANTKWNDYSKKFIGFVEAAETKINGKEINAGIKSVLDADGALKVLKPEEMEKLSETAKGCLENLKGVETNEARLEIAKKLKEGAIVPRTNASILGKINMAAITEENFAEIAKKNAKELGLKEMFEKASKTENAKITTLDDFIKKAVPNAETLKKRITNLENRANNKLASAFDKYVLPAVKDGEIKFSEAMTKSEQVLQKAMTKAKWHKAGTYGAIGAAVTGIAAYAAIKLFGNKSNQA